MIVMVMVYFWLESQLSFSHYGLIFNTLVHVFMYFYYFQASQGKSVFYKPWITRMQIVQFITSFLLSGIYLWLRWQHACSSHGDVAFWFSCVCNASFLFLFIQFYQKAYRNKM